jgi:hypothetical protein
VQGAAQLYFRWLVLTLQRSMGTPARELLPAVVQYTKEAAADRTAIESFAERAKKEKELATSKLHGTRKDKGGDDDRTQKVHDQIMGRGLPGSAPVKAMRMEDLIKVEQWEMSPGNVDGIFSNIVLPELRAQRDPRVFEYWDMKIKKEADLMKDKPAFDQEKFNKERKADAALEPRPGILPPRSTQPRRCGDVRGHSRESAASFAERVDQRTGGAA